MNTLVLYFCLLANPLCDEMTAVKTARPEYMFSSVAECQRHDSAVVQQVFEDDDELHDGRVYKVSAVCVKASSPA